MRLLDGRTFTAFVAGAVIATVSGTLGAAFASHGPRQAAAPLASAHVAAAAKPAPLITKACANKKTGAVTIVGTRHKKCASTEKAIRFASSLVANNGSFTVQSKNGAFVIVLNNRGIGLKGPGGSMVFDSSGVKSFDATGRQQ